MPQEHTLEPNVESDSDGGQSFGLSFGNRGDRSDIESRRTDRIFKALIGLATGGIVGALIGCLFVLVVLGGAQSWNDPGTLMGGRIGEHDITFTQTLTLWFGIFGGIIGGFLGLLIGIVTSTYRRNRIRH
jgi:hypothetical protein